MNEVKLGSLIDGSQQRDAIHIAVAPVIAGEDLRRGQGVTFESGSTDVVRPSDTKAIGVVDPFLPRNVKKGERFYMLLNPYSITGLRHEWTHPAFGATPKPHVSLSETWMRKWAKDHFSRDYYDDGGMGEQAAYEFAIRAGHELFIGPFESARDHIDNEWWAHWEAITGSSGQRGAYFSCAC